MKAARGLLWLPAMLGAKPAYAHAPVEGIKGFYIGLFHPFSTPSQALLMLGVGLMIGAFGVQHAWRVWAVFIAVCFVGLFAGSADLDVDVALFATAFVACGVAALGWGKFLPVALVVAATGGFLIGSASITDAGPLRDRIFTMSGSMVGATIGLLYIFAGVHILKERFTWAWVAIAFRVAAAWIGAISLVMLALSTVEPTVPG